MTLHDTLTEAKRQLVAAGIADAEASVDVDVFARTIMHWDRATLLTELRGPTPASLEPTFSKWVARREQREPTPYILGTREFWGLEFSVSPAVLIPRPESELIVEEALALLAVDSPLVADVGTGSGCLAIALATSHPSTQVIGTDVSPDALSVAEENARRHGVLDRVRFVHTSYLEGVDRRFDLVMANLPYVKDSDHPGLSRQVVGYEPHVALFGGPDGMRDIGTLLDDVRERLLPQGWLVLEFGLGQEDGVRELVGQRWGLVLVRCKHDLQGISRTAVIQRIEI